MKKITDFIYKNKLIFLIYALALIPFFIDVISKIIIIKQGNIIFEREIIPGFFNLTLTKNTGAAFSILENYSWLFIIIGIIGLLLITIMLKKECLNKLNIIAFSLLIGGICGNLFDRIINSYVIDFLDFRIFGYNFPIFNFADTFIVIGAFLLVIDFIRGERNEVRSKRK